MYFERLSGTSKLVPFPILTNLALFSAASEAAFSNAQCGASQW
jgi:hypothetical protein